MGDEEDLRSAAVSVPLIADSGAHENACGRARYLCSRRRLSADTARSSDPGERDRAAAIPLTIQIVGFVQGRFAAAPKTGRRECNRALGAGPRRSA